MHATVSTMILALALLGSDASRKASPAPAPAPTGPIITFETQVHDYGTIPFGGDGRCSFRFTNTGNAPLIIHQFQSSCGCLVPYWDRDPVAPGASANVRLLYDTRRVGPFRKSATLTTNDPERPRIVLSIRGEVLPPDTTRMLLAPAR